MKSIVTILALLFVSLTAFGGQGSNSLDCYKLTKFSCAKGIVDKAQLYQMIGSTVPDDYLTYLGSHGRSISYAEDLAVLIYKDSGTSADICNNNDKSTLEISVFEKAKCTLKTLEQ